MEIKIFRAFIVFTFFLSCLSMGLAQSMDVDHDNLYWKKLSQHLQENYKDSLAIWPERVVLQIANEQVSVDEPLFFKAYLIGGQNVKTFGKSGVLNLELLDSNGTLVKRQYHRVAEGMVQGQIELPKKISPGKYFVKAYTRWSQNYGSHFVALEKIWVGNVLERAEGDNHAQEIAILPEGGTLLSGHENRLIVKNTSNRANNTGDFGIIMDENKQEVAKVTFYTSGLGSAIFKPMENKIYHLQLESGENFPLPEAVSDGYLLHVNNLDDSYAKIRITASASAQKQNVSLIGTSGGITFFEKKLDFGNRNVLDMELAKSNFPFGVFTLKLVDDFEAELAKRPIWIDGNRLQIAIKPVNTHTDSDAKTFKIKVTDETNTPIKSRVAISINRQTPVSVSALENPKIPFGNLSIFTEVIDKKNTSMFRKRSFLQDLDLLASSSHNTMAYSNVDIADASKKSLQKGLELTGHAYDLNDELLSNTKIQVLVSNEDDFWVGEVETDALGLLKLEDIQITGKATLVARTKGDETQSRLVKIVPLSESEIIGKGKNQSLAVSKTPQQTESKKNEVSESLPMDQLDKTIELDEVEVTKTNTKRKIAPSLYGPSGPFTKVIQQDFDKPMTLAQMLMRFPGVIVTGVETLNPTVRIMGTSGSILWVLDGFPLSQLGGATQLGSSSSSPLTDIMALANGRDIERVEFLKGPDAALYGSRASAGVFIIYTRTGKEQASLRRKDGQLDFEGYVPPLDFNKYKESLSRRKENRVNLLYWNPSLETDENGEATITLPKLPEDIVIKIEATTISKDGKIGFSSFVN